MEEMKKAVKAVCFAVKNPKKSGQNILSAVKKQVSDARCGQSGQKQKPAFLNLEKFNLT
jgi:hypothetical protein